MKQRCSKKPKKTAENMWRQSLKKAEKEGIEVKTLVQLGRFAVVCLDVVNQVRPSLIVTTRSRRPKWVKKFFGAPVDELIAKAGCPVVAV